MPLGVRRLSSSTRKRPSGAADDVEPRDRDPHRQLQALQRGLVRVDRLHRPARAPRRRGRSAAPRRRRRSRRSAPGRAGRARPRAPPIPPRGSRAAPDRGGTRRRREGDAVDRRPCGREQPARVVSVEVGRWFAERHLPTTTQPATITTRGRRARARRWRRPRVHGACGRRARGAAGRRRRRRPRCSTARRRRRADRRAGDVARSRPDRPVGAAPRAFPDLRPPPPTALTIDPDTGELEAPLGAVANLGRAVLGLASAFGGRSVATAEFATRDPATADHDRRARGRAARAGGRRPAVRAARGPVSGRCTWCGERGRAGRLPRLSRTGGGGVLPARARRAVGDPRRRLGAGPAGGRPAGGVRVVRRRPRHLLLERSRGEHRVHDQFCGVAHLLEWAKAGGRYR